MNEWKKLSEEILHAKHQPSRKKGASLNKQESKKMNINELGARIDRPTIRELIAYATCRNRPISNSTLLRMEKDGRIPCRLKTPLTSPVWDTREVLKALGLQQ